MPEDSIRGIGSPSIYLENILRSSDKAENSEMISVCCKILFGSVKNAPRKSQFAGHNPDVELRWREETSDENIFQDISGGWSGTVRLLMLFRQGLRAHTYRDGIR